MGSWTLGRCGLDVPASSADAPANWDLSGDVVSFSGDLRASSVIDAKFLRLQLNGALNNVDVPVVPFTWSEDPASWDGYYRVTDLTVGTVALSLSAGWFPFSVTMERLADASAAPLIQGRTLGALRVNGHGIVAGTSVAWHSPGAGTYGYQPSATIATLTGSEGGVLVATPASNAMFDRTNNWFVPPASFYLGGSRVEFTADGGSTYRTVSGRQATNLPTAWRVSNSLMRVSGSATANKAEFTVQHHDGSQWETAKTYRLGALVGGLYADWGVGPTLVQILRNSPECAIVRVHFGPAGAGDRTYLDFMLRRGARYVELYLGASVSRQWAISRTATEALTGVTGGARATASDADGNKITLATTAAFTVASAPDSVILNAPTQTASFAVGSAIGGSTTVAQDQIYQYMAVVNETQRIVVG